MSLFDTATLGLLGAYGCATVCGVVGMVYRHPLVRRAACLLVGLTFAAQTVTFLLGVHSGGPTLGAYLQLMAWFVALCGLVGAWKWRMNSPAIFAAPLSFIGFLLSLRYLDAHIRMPEAVSGPFYALHIGSLFLSLGLLSIAFGAALLFLFMEGKIKSKSRVSGFWQDFPALAVLDKINHYGTFFGFPLYTVGLVSGFFWASGAFGKSVSGDPKEVVSLIVWAVYALLFHMRVVRGRRGRKPALMTICVYALSLFSVLVVNTYMDTHHAFGKRQ